jgi:predicted methyltransferase
VVGNGFNLGGVGFQIKQSGALALRNRWRNVKSMINQMNFLVSHIYREGNQIADSLANFGRSLNNLEVWEEIPSFIIEQYVKDRLGLSQFRFIYF